MRQVLCRLLIALMIWTPYQIAQAGMIGTDQIVSASSNLDRANLLNILSRPDVASQLQLLGVDPVQAKDRVQSMSDEDLAAITNNLDSLPAGGISNGWTLVLIILIVGAIWWWYMGGMRR
jgi:hypothetical protein